MRKQLVMIVAILMVLSAVLTACSGGSGGGATTISATMTDFKFDPNTWTVPAGKEITLKLTNDGAVSHDWVLVVKQVTPPADANSSDILFKVEVPAGGNQEVKFTSPSAPGEYEVICTVPGHLESGMSGKLVVTQ